MARREYGAVGSGPVGRGKVLAQQLLSNNPTSSRWAALLPALTIQRLDLFRP